MNATIRYYQGNNDLQLEISPKAPRIIYIVFWLFYVIGPITTGTFITKLLIDISDPSTTILLGLCVMWSIHFGFIYQYAKKLYEKQFLSINSSSCTLITNSPFGTHKANYDTKHISSFEYAQKDSFTPHPLDPQGCVDYLGFGTREQEVQWLIASEKLFLNYKDETIPFGRNLCLDQSEYILTKLNQYLSTKTPD